MLKQTSRVASVVIITSFTLLAYNNCAPALNINESRSPASVSNQDTQIENDLSSPLVSAQKIELSGAGNATLNYSGCTAPVRYDFVTKIPAHENRLEPQDCAKLQVTTPVFVWPQPRDWIKGRNFTLTIEGQVAGTFSRTITTASLRNFVSNPLPVGKYKWKVSYPNTSYGTSQSEWRNFEISSGAFRIPSGQEFANAVLSRPHPRIQPHSSTSPTQKLSWTNIKSRINANGYSESFHEYLMVQLNKSYSFQLPSLPINRQQSLELKSALTNLAYGYHFIGDRNYFRRATMLLAPMAEWRNLVAVDSDSEDQVNRELHSAMALCLDLFYAEFNEAANIPLRNKLVSAVKNRMGLVQFGTYDRYPYDSHLLTNSFYSMESMMYAAGIPGIGFGTTSDDGGRSELIRLWDNAIISVGTWGGAMDSGWANGGGYGWYGADAYVRFLTHTKLMANIDLSNWNALGRFGLNQIYFTAPLNKIRQAFGDDGDATNYFQQYAHDTFRLFAMVTKKPEYEWYWRFGGTAAQNNRSMMNPLHYMLAATFAAPPTYTSFNPSNLSKSIAYLDAGVVALHSDMARADRSSVYFRSSRFGSFNHNHADQNSFTFVSKGKDILISNSVYDRYGSPHHKITRSTRYKNALTFDGGVGQAEPTEQVVPNAPGEPIKGIMDFGGRIVNYSDDGTWAITTGDASKAYGGMKLEIGRFFPFVQKAYRTIAYNRAKGIVVIYDWARSTTPRSWELNFHTLKANNPVMVPGSAQTIKMENEVSKTCMKVWHPSVISTYYDDFKEGWEVAPSKTDYAPTKSMRLHVREPAQEFTAVTILDEGCTGRVNNVTFSGTSEAYVFIDGLKAVTLGGTMVRTAD